MGRSLKNIGVIFDVDGTLIDTSMLSVPAVHEVAKEVGLPHVKDEDITNCIGVSSIDFYKCFYHGLDDEFLYDFDEKVQALERQLIRDLEKKILFEGIENLLHKMKDLGICLAVASTGSDQHVNTVLHTMGIWELFDRVKCNHDNKAGMIREIIEIHPEKHWFMVGDKGKDSSSAKANGISSIGVEYGFSRDIDLVDFDWLVEKPDEIISIILEKVDNISYHRG